MSIKRIVDTVSVSHGLTKVKTRRILDQVLNLIITDAKDNVVRLPHFGTFKTIERQSRVCRNVYTGAPIQVPAKKILKFKPSKSTEIINV